MNGRVDAWRLLEWEMTPRRKCRLPRVKVQGGGGKVKAGLRKVQFGMRMGGEAGEVGYSTLLLHQSGSGAPPTGGRSRVARGAELLIPFSVCCYMFQVKVVAASTEPHVRH